MTNQLYGILCWRAVTCFAGSEVPSLLLGIEVLSYYVLSQLNLVHAHLFPPVLTVFL
jgi:hypothetical protein